MHLRVSVCVYVSVCVEGVLCELTELPFTDLHQFLSPATSTKWYTHLSAQSPLHTKYIILIYYLTNVLFKVCGLCLLCVHVVLGNHRGGTAQRDRHGPCGRQEAEGSVFTDTFMGYKTCSRFFSPVYGAETAVIIKYKYTDILKCQVYFQSSYNSLKLHFNFMWVPDNTRQKLVGKTIIYIIIKLVKIMKWLIIE